MRLLKVVATIPALLIFTFAIVLYSLASLIQMFARMGLPGLRSAITIARAALPRRRRKARLVKYASTRRVR